MNFQEWSFCKLGLKNHISLDSFCIAFLKAQGTYYMGWETNFYAKRKYSLIVWMWIDLTLLCFVK